jgi:hypothetical protein
MTGTQYGVIAFYLAVALTVLVFFSGCANQHGVICLETAAEQALDPASCQ